MPDDGESASLLTYAGFGGVAVCCLGIELLGGAAILGGLAATIGLSTGLTYLVVVGIGGLVAALLVLAYRQFGGTSHV
jgi:hypothetical protein